MARSLKKGPYVDQKLLKKIRKVKSKEKEVIRTWSRACTITPEMVGFTFGVHNGKEFLPVKVNEDMVGHRLGEFSPTKKFLRHGGRMQRELEQRAAKREAEKRKKAKE
ncbi:MAG: 30S ribosomal protein S19 [Candidatus Paceibacterales bacterium]